MDNYKKPKCDCGTFLQATRSEYWSVTRNITKDGNVSERIVRLNTGFDDSDYEIKLRCPKCGNTYNSDYDDKDRLIRADLDI